MLFYKLLFFLLIKNMFTIFAVLYKHDGGQIRLYATGFFYALLQTIYGFVPPCVRVMQSLPSWCIATGKAEPFFILPKKQLTVMLYTEKNCLNVNNSTVPATSAHETCAKFIEYLHERYPNLNQIKYKISKNGKHLSLRASYKRRRIHAHGFDFERTMNTFLFYMILKLSIDKYYPTVEEMREKLPAEPFFVWINCAFRQNNKEQIG